MAQMAIVCKIKTSPHPKADRLKIGDACGNTVVVGIDTQDDTLGVFFNCDLRLSDEFLKANDLLPKYDENGKRLPGVTFEENGRVRAKSIRGVKSEGYWVPLSLLNFTGADLSKLYEGQELSELNGVPLCSKYITKHTASFMARQQARLLRHGVHNFPKHYDTQPFNDKVSLPTEGQYIITEKYHGTSARYGKCKVDVKLPWYKKLINKVFSIFPTEQYQIVVGTRNTIISGETGGLDGKGNPYLVHKHLFDNLKEDEIVYGEIVGYMPNGDALFTHNLSELKKDKDFPFKWLPDNTEYSYGCEKGQSKFLAYRIVQNGKELTYEEMFNRCKQLGIEPVLPFITYRIYPNSRIAGAVAHAEEYLSKVQSGRQHLTEGLCLRLESPEGIKVYKKKFFWFKVAEGIIKNNDNYIDSEEIM